MITEEKLKEAIRLREGGDMEASRQLLLELVSANPNHPMVLFQCAWTHDGMGLERSAVDFYERAIAAGLGESDLSGAYLGLGSTLRGLGEYKRALEVLDRGVKEFPGKKSLAVFRAMALYNNDESKKAISNLLELLVETSSDPDIAGYRRAILLYARDLDRVWEN